MVNVTHTHLHIHYDHAQFRVVSLFLIHKVCFDENVHDCFPSSAAEREKNQKNQVVLLQVIRNTFINL